MTSNFGDNMATLHSPSGLTGIFEDGADQVALYRAGYSVYLPLVLSSSGGAPTPADGIPTSNVVSFVAWGGDPGSDAIGAVTAGVWGEGLYKDLRQIGDETAQPVYPGRSRCLLPGGAASSLPGQLGSLPGGGGNAGARQSDPGHCRLLLCVGRDDR